MGDDIYGDSPLLSLEKLVELVELGNVVVSCHFDELYVAGDTVRERLGTVVSQHLGRKYRSDSLAIPMTKVGCRDQ
jgi:hypothetical protein